MRFPILVSRSAFILLGAVFGAVGFAIAGAVFGFFSFLHWFSGAALVASIIYLAPRLFVVVPDSGPRE